LTSALRYAAALTAGVGLALAATTGLSVADNDGATVSTTGDDGAHPGDVTWSCGYLANDVWCKNTVSREFFRVTASQYADQGSGWNWCEKTLHTGDLVQKACAEYSVDGFPPNNIWQHGLYKWAGPAAMVTLHGFGYGKY